MSKQPTPQGPTLKDGQALDRLTERTEEWARSYGRIRDESRWADDFDARFAKQADSFAEQCTPAARRFTARDWILAIVLWAMIAMIVFVGAVVLLSLQGTTTLVFLAFAVLVGVVGLWQTYLETTSEARAAKKLEKKREWLYSVSRKAAMSILQQRAAKTDA